VERAAGPVAEYGPRKSRFAQPRMRRHRPTARATGRPRIAIVVLLPTLALLSALSTASPRAAVLHRPHLTVIPARHASHRRAAPPRIQARVVTSSRAALMSIAPFSASRPSTGHSRCRGVALLDRVLSLVRGPRSASAPDRGRFGRPNVGSPGARSSGVGVRADAAWLREVRTINSVTCGGVRGVSNTLVTALWAPDALFELRRRGRLRRHPTCAPTQSTQPSRWGAMD
jgi:hypothetical protein